MGREDLNRKIAVGNKMWVNQIINVVLENKTKKTFYEKSLWTHDDLNIIIQFSAGYNWGALELTSDQYELIEEMSYDENAYDTQYNAPSRFDIKICEGRLFAYDRHFFGTEFCKLIQPKDTQNGPDDRTFENMLDLSWFKSSYNIETGDVIGLFSAMSDNDWVFRGHSYSVDGEITVMKKGEYDYLWLEEENLDINDGRTTSNYDARIKILGEINQS
ncbi:MAG: hypothetical protein CMM58_02910 [Rhodospirillaceae bacterium]|nr:hypothetical protein [Rhodospirillaceae bacterium]